MSTAARTSSPAANRPGAKQQPAWLLPAIGVGLALIVLAVGYALTATPSNESLPTDYGRRRGSGFAPSASGTAALAEMFKAAGYRVQTFTRLSPKLKEADVIVWAPDDFEPPGTKQREFLENWLADGEGRSHRLYRPRL